jgi:hypothetical protein
MTSSDFDQMSSVMEKKAVQFCIKLQSRALGVDTRLDFEIQPLNYMGALGGIRTCVDDLRICLKSDPQNPSKRVPDLDEEQTLQLNEFETRVVRGFNQWGKLVDAWKETAKVRIAELTEQVAHLQQKELRRTEPKGSRSASKKKEKMEQVLSRESARRPSSVTSSEEEHSRARSPSKNNLMDIVLSGRESVMSSEGQEYHRSEPPRGSTASRVNCGTRWQSRSPGASLAASAARTPPRRIRAPALRQPLPTWPAATRGRLPEFTPVCVTAADSRRALGARAAPRLPRTAPKEVHRATRFPHISEESGSNPSGSVPVLGATASQQSGGEALDALSEEDSSVLFVSAMRSASTLPGKTLTTCETCDSIKSRERAVTYDNSDSMAASSSSQSKTGQQKKTLWQKVLGTMTGKKSKVVDQQ